MAGSRLEKIANIFSRATGLLRTGALKYEDRPIWYDVYRVFPPKYEPRYNREIDPSITVNPIFYDEDLVRAQFFSKFGLNPGGGVRDLKAVGEEDDCQRFITSYNSFKNSNPDWTHTQIFDAACQNFGSRRKTETVQEWKDEPKRRVTSKLITKDSLLSMFQESKQANVSSDDNKNS